MVNIKWIQKVPIALASIALVCALTAVTAYPPSHTPLFTVRMEQVSSEMKFLPTAVEEFVYTAEQGYELDFDAPVEQCRAEPLAIARTMLLPAMLRVDNRAQALAIRARDCIRVQIHHASTRVLQLPARAPAGRRAKIRASIRVAHMSAYYSIVNNFFSFLRMIFV